MFIYEMQDICMNVAENEIMAIGSKQVHNDTFNNWGAAGFQNK
jgi:hypothetical protein